ncbi:MAG: hypothetical protein KBT12_01020 [Bacteroidales bacterium]|nr:hypothetical protein [Candidatus Physcousia equi]
MKKFTSLLVLLLTALCSGSVYADVHEDLQGAKLISKGAQVTTLDELVPGTWYFVQQDRDAAGYMTSVEGKENLMKMNIDPNCPDGSLASDKASYLWQFIAVDEEPEAGVVEAGYDAKVYKVVNGLGIYMGEAGHNGGCPPELDAESAIACTWYPFETGTWGVMHPAGGIRLDNNGANGNLNFWNNDANATGNNEWQIYLVDFEETSELTIAANALATKAGTYTDRYNYFDEEINPIEHTIPAAIINAFKDAFTKASSFDIDDPDNEGATVASIEKLGTDLDKAWEAVVAAVNKPILPGYYYIRSGLKFNAIPPQTEMRYDEELGEETEVTIEEGRVPRMGIYADGNTLKWMEIDKTSAKFLFKIENAETADQYILKTGATGLQLSGFSNGATLGKEQNPVTITYAGFGSVEEYEAFDEAYYDIRLASSTANGDYLHAGGHGGGSGKSGNVVNWSPGYNASTMSPSATEWVLVPVDEATAKAILDGPAAKIAAMIDEANAIAANFPAQKEVAIDKDVALDTEHPVITQASQFSSPYSHNDINGSKDGQDLSSGCLIDGDSKTYWHSDWGTANPAPNGVHYLQISGIGDDVDGVAFEMVRRSGAQNDHITKMSIYGVTEDQADFTDNKGELELLAELSYPYKAAGETLKSDVFETKGYSIIRIYEEETTNNRGYWHAAEIQLYPATISQKATISQAQARKAEIEALEAAVAAWEEAGYTLENVEDPEDADFKAAYNAIKTAGDAWNAVYTNPAALRTAMEAVPASDLFVQGNNPGQWTTVPAIASVVKEAEDYDNSGAYTPAKSAELTEKITKAGEDALASANKVKEGKWYRISFPTEAMYEKYGWDKTGADARYNENIEMDASPALFGKTLCVGGLNIDEETYTDPETDEEVTINVSTTRKFDAAKDATFKGSLHFLESKDVTADYDLFRFVNFGDSAYAIQNKATGLYVRALGANSTVQLDVQPTLIEQSAIGAGANLLKARSFTRGQNQTYLHAQRDANKLCSWDATAIGSNSMMLITEVADVTAEPTTDMTMSLWTGGTYTMCLPTAIKIDAAAGKAYSVKAVGVDDEAKELSIELSEYTEGAEIAAGQPFIYVADGEYEVYDTRKKINEGTADEPNWVDNPDYNVDNFVIVKATRGTELAKAPRNKNLLVGALDATKTGVKGCIWAKSDFSGFAVSASATDTYAANTAVIVPENVLTTAQTKYEVTSDVKEKNYTKITEALNSISKKGEIYTLDGKYCGTSLNKLGRGIYVVNGVKVVIK